MMITIIVNWGKKRLLGSASFLFSDCHITFIMAALLGMDRISNWPISGLGARQTTGYPARHSTLNLIPGLISDIWKISGRITDWIFESSIRPNIRSIPSFWSFCIVVMQNINPATKIFAV